MDYAFLTRTLLFNGTSPEEVKEMLSCLGAKEKEYDKGEILLRAGETTDLMGLVLAGSANIEMDDIWGNKTILGHVAAGQLFAETYACVPGEALMVNVAACEKCTVLFLSTARLLDSGANGCGYTGKLVRNLLKISAQKNLNLSRRMLHTAPKSIRGRLLSYFSEQVRQNGSYSFRIPYNRQQLADYLGVDRSAMSAELGKMQKEGLLVFRKNCFELKE